MYMYIFTIRSERERDNRTIYAAGRLHPMRFVEKRTFSPLLSENESPVSTLIIPDYSVDPD